MRILICGATGFLGWRTTKWLAAHPAVTHVTATGRTLRPTHQLADPKVAYLLGDLQDSKHIDRLFATQPDAVVNCASLSSPWGKISAFRGANVDTQRLLIAAAERAQLDHFVYISSPSVYAMRSDQVDIHEDEPLPKRFANAYAQTKAEAEALLSSSTLPWITLRPRALTGEGDTVIMPRLIRAHTAGRLRIIGDGKNVVDLTSVDNVAQAIGLALGLDAGNPTRQTVSPSALRQAYNITNGRPVALWPTINGVLAKLDLPEVTKRLPRSAAMTVATLAETIARIRPSSPEPVLTRYGVQVLADSVTLNIDKARRLLGYQPHQSLATALDAYVAWHKQHVNAH